MSILFTSIFNDSYVTLFWGVIIGIMSIWVCPSFVPCPLLFIEKSLEAHTWKVWCDPDLRPLDESKCHIVINKVSFKILLLAMKHMIISIFFIGGGGWVIDSPWMDTSPLQVYLHRKPVPSCRWKDWDNVDEVHCLGSQHTTSSDHNGTQTNDLWVTDLSTMTTEPCASINMVYIIKWELQRFF